MENIYADTDKSAIDQYRLIISANQYIRRARLASHILIKIYRFLLLLLLLLSLSLSLSQVCSIQFNWHVWLNMLPKQKHNLKYKTIHIKKCNTIHNAHPFSLILTHTHTHTHTHTFNRSLLSIISAKIY